jgi:hypothetical protein
LCRSSGSAVRLSRNDMDFDPAEARQVEDADDTPERNQDTSIVAAGSVTKQEPGRITVTFPTDVPDLETGLWRCVTVLNMAMTTRNLSTGLPQTGSMGIGYCTETNDRSIPSLAV